MTDPDCQVPVEQEGTCPATLAKQPRTLAELWEEYQVGIGGRKPAKDWTSTERGNRTGGLKQKYYRRKMVWWTIEELMRRGGTRDSAINKIRSAYGWRCSVTQIINFIIHDHQDGRTGHANLVDLTPRLRNGGRRNGNGGRRNGNSQSRQAQIRFQPRQRQQAPVPRAEV